MVMVLREEHYQRFPSSYISQAGLIYLTILLASSNQVGVTCYGYWGLTMNEDIDTNTGSKF